MEYGYQNMFRYRHSDGSFSSFGPRQDIQLDKPVNGSTWLTAYVIRSFQQIGEFITVDPNLVEEGLKYLVKRQNKNGSFHDLGDYFYAANHNDIFLTSSVLLAFAQNEVKTSYSLYFL